MPESTTTTARTQGPSPTATAGTATAGSATAAATTGTEAPGGKKRKKKKYSRATKGGQKAERALTKGVHRLARAVEEGLGTWRKNRDRSARRKKDGALKDAFKNYGKAMSKLAKVAAKVPEEVTDALPSVKRLLRP